MREKNELKKETTTIVSVTDNFNYWKMPLFRFLLMISVKTKKKKSTHIH